MYKSKRLRDHNVAEQRRDWRPKICRSSSMDGLTLLAKEPRHSPYYSAATSAAAKYHNRLSLSLSLSLAVCYY